MSFKHFPQNATCILCGSKEDKECTLVAILGTESGGNAEALPIHVECIVEGLSISRKDRVIFKYYEEEEEECISL